MSPTSEVSDVDELSSAEVAVSVGGDVGGDTDEVTSDDSDEATSVCVTEVDIESVPLDVRPLAEPDDSVPDDSTLELPAPLVGFTSLREDKLPLVAAASPASRSF